MFKWPTRTDSQPFMLIMIAVLLADWAVKSYMLALIFHPPRVIELTSFLNLAPVWNEGISFGLLAEWGTITRYGISALAVIVSLWLFFQLPFLLKWQKRAAALIAGGAIGNMVDRLIYGKVVDFIDFHLGSWHYPAFNVADATIFIGVAVWLISMLYASRHQNKEKDKPDEA